MTTLVGQVFEEASIRKDANDNLSIHKYRNALRSKERKLRYKCNTALKKKLKKYKLRQNGKEDQDILDVSGILESSLVIKLPNEFKSTAELELEKLRPTNYLFKMGRRKQGVNITEKSVKSKIILTETSEQSSPTIESTKQDAFKLLMDSRNKSMGQNSPGKDKPIQEIEKQELLETKSNKAKRNLLLQKMAESKGSLKKKELEENLTKCINKKMEKRVKRLKSLISNIEPKSEKKDPNTHNGRNPLNSIKPDQNEKISTKTIKTLQLVNMFTEIECTNEIKREISKEDAEFLKKLSPSLKKKESMLSYFKKLETEPDCSIIDYENDNSVIKVKLGTKTKKRGRKKRLTLSRDKTQVRLEEELKPTQEVETVIDETAPQNKQNLQTDITEIEETSKKERKRKRYGKVTFYDDAAVSSSNILVCYDDGRLRRSAKKPVRYIEDPAISSSDEELHIFTPKKKKVSNENITIVDLTPEVIEKTELTKIAERHVKTKKCTPKNTDKSKIIQKPVKLAPIFATKSQLDPAANEAKQKFLQSGVPEKLKKMMLKQVDNNIVSNYFLRVFHIQQLEMSNNLEPIQLNIAEDSSTEDQNDPIISKDLTFKMLLSMQTSQETLISANHTNPQTVLQNLKEKYPRYPVYRTYRLLRGKKKGDYKVSNNYLDLDNSVEVLNASIDNQNENPEQLSWSEKYKPLAASEIIGNFESVKELRKWLVSWTESDMKRKANNGCDSDSSDFCHSEDDSRDSVKSSNNLLVLSGPVGSGKTSSVYAVAAELSIKVIEVNASSKRTGKIMLQDLQEATQSHKVNRQTSSNENSQNSQKLEAVQPTPITNSIKKRGRPKKNADSGTVKPVLNKKSFKEKIENPNGVSASQDGSRTCMSLILIDDADIVFDQDDGFCSAIVQLVHSSKRPVILITSSLSCPHLQRFIQSSKILKLNPLLPNILGTWLDIMCLADSGICWPGTGSQVLNFFKGDVRKTINCLQFYVCSQEQTSQEIETFNQNTDCHLNMDDEASNMSWMDRDADDKHQNIEATEIYDSVKSLILQKAHSRQNRCPNAMFNIWWNVPKLLSISETKSSDELTDRDNAPKNEYKSIESLSQVLDSLSLCDLYSGKSSSVKGHLSSDPWFSDESHSVSELENFDKYDRHYGISNEIAHELACGSISIAQDKFGCEKKIHLDIPGMSQQRQKDRTVSLHKNLTSFLSPQAVLDRKALALDYWPTCRSICRIEKCKTDTNSKRNNRFCHYLKSLSVLCKNESFDKLTYSLCPSKIDIK